MPDVGSQELDNGTAQTTTPAAPAPPQWSPIMRVDYNLLASKKEEDFVEFAKMADKATTTLGFMLLENPPISRKEIDKHFALMKRFFNEASMDEKSSIPTYMGYKALGEGTVHPITKQKDCHERLNIPKFTPATWPDTWFPFFDQPDQNPPGCEDLPLFPTIKDFVKDFSIRSHAIARELLRVFAYNFGVPDDEGGKEYFEGRHRYDEPSGDHIRWLKYPFRSIADDAKEGSPIRLGAHTDHGSLTLLFSQPVGGLQVWRTDENGHGRFEYVQPLETGSIIINLGDAISFWTDGVSRLLDLDVTWRMVIDFSISVFAASKLHSQYLKSTLHRVVRPPPPQEAEVRYSLVYFTRPEDSQRLYPIPRKIPSGAQGNTLIQRMPDEEWPTAKDWIRVKIEKGSETGFKDREAWLKANPWVNAE